jgi:hypothetical protein
VGLEFFDGAVFAAVGDEEAAPIGMIGQKRGEALDGFIDEIGGVVGWENEGAMERSTSKCFVRWVL